MDVKGGAIFALKVAAISLIAVAIALRFGPLRAIVFRTPSNPGAAEEIRRAASHVGTSALEEV